MPNHQKTQQETIYIDKNGKQVKTNQHDLLYIESKKIIQIGFYQNYNGEIQSSQSWTHIKTEINEEKETKPETPIHEIEEISKQKISEPRISFF